MRRRALLWAVLLAAGCEDQSGLPLPVPIPDVAQIRSSRAELGQVQTVQVVGLPGAVSGAGAVSASAEGVKVDAPATAGGTFALSIAARGGGTIALSYAGSATVKLVVPAMTHAPAVALGPIDGVPPIAAAAGKVTVRGRVDAAAVIGANLDTGDVAAAPVSSGTFSLELPGQSGQRIRVFIDDGTLGDIGWDLSVP